MKKKLFITLIIVVLIFIIGISTYEKESFYDVYAEVEIPVTEYNFGTITYNDTINYNFKIKNTGKESLLITRVLPNCTCTVIDYNNRIILPNNETEIKARFIPNKVRLGKNSASILVEGNFNGGVTHLKLKGFVTDIH